MSTITFDTLKFANTLKAAGVPPAQAEAEAVALSEVLEVNLKDLVSKEYMLHEMRDLEQRQIIKLDALMALSISIVAALVKLL
jgi:flagellar motor switch/type III secretory pathway protein FliN